MSDPTGEKIVKEFWVCWKCSAQFDKPMPQGHPTLEQRLTPVPGGVKIEHVPVVCGPVTNVQILEERRL